MKIDPNSAEFQLERARDHNGENVRFAATGLVGIGRLISSIPFEEGVSYFTDLQLEELGYAIRSLGNSIRMEVEIIEEAIEKASEVINTAKEESGYED
ncbi:MAG: hypothetical protein V7731_08540 [Amphritea sp.]